MKRGYERRGEIVSRFKEGDIDTYDILSLIWNVDTIAFLGA